MNRTIKRLASKSLAQLGVGLDSTWAGKIALGLLTGLTRKPGPLARSVIGAFQPSNPLHKFVESPPIELLWVASEKDFDVLPLSIEGATKNVENYVERATLIVPKASFLQAQKRFSGVSVLEEESFIPPEILRAVKESAPPGRMGWLLQQVIGLYFCLQSQRNGVLWIDADTVLTRPRNFLGRKSVQLLSFSKEFHQEYENHSIRNWPESPRINGLSYVTHHQLMQPEVVREMFPDGALSLIKWIRTANKAARSSVSEFHCYGRYLTTHKAPLVRFARWANKTLPRESLSGGLNTAETLDYLQKRFPEAYSVSLHSYLQA